MQVDKTFIQKKKVHTEDRIEELGMNMVILFSKIMGSKNLILFIINLIFNARALLSS